MPEFTLHLRVYIEDTDAGGIVYYVNYLKYMERARTEMMRERGFAKAGIFSSELMFVVNRVAINYQRPARLDDELRVSASISNLGAATLQFRQGIWRDRELLCEADVSVACVDRHSLKPRRIPLAMRRALQGIKDQ